LRVAMVKRPVRQVVLLEALPSAESSSTTTRTCV
jgi:hypothetical protein